VGRPRLAVAPSAATDQPAAHAAVTGLATLIARRAG